MKYNFRLLLILNFHLNNKIFGICSILIVINFFVIGSFVLIYYTIAFPTDSHNYGG